MRLRQAKKLLKRYALGHIRLPSTALARAMGTFNRHRGPHSRAPLAQYVLGPAGCPVPVLNPRLLSTIVWGRFMATMARVVAVDLVGNVRVSTVFLGINHNFLGGSPPLLFETMTFVDEERPGPAFDQSIQERYYTRAEALAGHEKVVALVMMATRAEPRRMAGIGASA